MPADCAMSDVQVIIWDIMKDVKVILEKNNIKYFMLCGTLLGAVRHKGFIPWDDDIDIGIPREQYEWVLQNIEKYLPDHLELKTFKNDPEYHYCFARVCDKRHTVKRTGSEEERTEEIWIDIFPLDGVPNNTIVRQFHKVRLIINRGLYHMSCFEKINLKRPGRPFYQRAIIKFVQVTGFGRGGNTQERLIKLDNMLKKYPYEKSKYIVDFMGQYMFKAMFPKELYDQGKMYTFEDAQMMGPVDYDTVLKKIYGEYMVIPKNKNTHASEFIG